MEDVQRHAPKVPINIDRVGIRGITVPLLVRDRAQGSRQTVARVDLGVDLPASFKGTHMSRFIEALEEWNDEINYQSVRRLLATVKERLEARRSYVRFCFPYFVHKPAPSSGIKSIISYECRLTGELDEKGQSFLLEVDVPVMTVCPCSKAISREGAHSQRTMIHLAVRMSGFSWIEEFIVRRLYPAQARGREIRHRARLRPAHLRGGRGAQRGPAPDGARACALVPRGGGEHGVHPQP